MRRAKKATYIKRDPDLTGQRFGRLLVECISLEDAIGASWTCQCDCGRKRLVRTKALTGGKAFQCQSCSKQQRDRIEFDAKMKAMRESADITNDAARERWGVALPARPGDKHAMRIASTLSIIDMKRAGYAWGAGELALPKSPRMPAFIDPWRPEGGFGSPAAMCAE